MKDPKGPNHSLKFCSLSPLTAEEGTTALATSDNPSETTNT